ncbi:MAG: ABC transporter permease [Victivallaceae bacterium]|nr:ABC transporter permease [Victivallaceae bacterium]
MSGNTRQWKKLFSRPSGYLTVLVLALYLGFALATEIHDVICRHRHETPIFEIADPDNANAAPSRKHPLGTDYQGRDVLVRAVAGTASALKVGLISSAIAVAIGVTLGSSAGFRGGFVDDLVTWLYSVFASMPSLLFILAFALLVSRGFLPPGAMKCVRVVSQAINTDPCVLAVYIAIGLTGWVTICKVTRAETMKLRRSSFVDAALVAGVPRRVIIRRHILPNLAHLIIIYFTLTFAGAIMMEVIVSYLGLGVQTAPSWGTMISDGQQRLWRGEWWEIATATGFMFLLVLSLNILGDAIRDAFDPKSA